MPLQPVKNPSWNSRIRSLAARAERIVFAGVRWIAPRFGLEGKILAAMMLVLTSAIAAANWVWTSQSSATVADIMGEQARQMAYTLSLAAQPEMQSKDYESLRIIGRDLLKTRNILFVVFYDAHGRCVAIAHRDTKDQAIPPSLQRADVQSLAQVRMGVWPQVGQFLQVNAPILAGTTSLADLTTMEPARLMGYVSVGVSPWQAQMQIRRNQLFAGFVGCTMILIGLPLTYVLVHRIFAPIRNLVSATERIATGDLDTRVATDRHDAIGDLARAFNEMVKTVKHQRERLEASNEELERNVAQRTAQLETANKRLSTEIAEKEDFLRAISHDLNAPLRNIAGMATMLLMKYRDQFEDDVIHRLERIQKNVEAETDLIAELLELSRIKTRRQKMEMVEIGPLVRELEDIFESDLKNGNISLLIDNPLPILNGERARFRQIFQKFTSAAPSGSPRRNFTSATPAWGSMPTICPESFTSSAAERVRQRATSPARASDWPASKASSRPIAARSGSKASRARAARSDSPSTASMSRRVLRARPKSLSRSNYVTRFHHRSAREKAVQCPAIRRPKAGRASGNHHPARR